MVYSNLGLLLNALGRLDEAEDCLEKSLAIRLVQLYL